MRTSAVIAGVGMTRFARHEDVGLKALGADAVRAALADAGVEASRLEAAWVGNAAAGVVTGQECIRGEVILRGMGIGQLPVVNVENACASGSTALNQACAMVTAGCHDVVLVLGVEKLYHPDKQRTFRAFSGGVDVELLEQILAALRASAGEQGGGDGGAGRSRSMFMDIYAAAARHHMAAYGTTVEDFAAVAAKNSLHGSRNPRAQFQQVLTVAEVLAAPMIAPPLTRPMCSPIGDGAAAAVVVSSRMARMLGVRVPVHVRSSVLRSGWDHAPDEPGVAELCAQVAYTESGLGPDDVDVVELHDASAPAELMAYESLGLCAKGDGKRLVRESATQLGGRIPVNTSGGLLRKGHPVGATGVAQVVELTEQLQGRAGARQVPDATVALAHNGGGNIGVDAAALCVTVLTR